jgi:protease-4
MKHTWMQLLGMAGLMAGGCSPVTVSFTFGGESRKLGEAVVVKDERAGADKIGMIDIRGIISDQSGGGLFGAGSNPVDELAARLLAAEADSNVKAVILRINSPGGGVTASDMMYREVRRFREKTGKPVVASLGEVAASGGYYLALSADTIVAEPTSITGSIGVIIPTVNVSAGLASIGVRTRNLTSGPNKDMGDPLTPPREDHYALLQGLVDEFYGRFKGLVVARRPGLKPGLAGEVMDGRVVSGSRAVEAGLADREGGVREAFEEAKKLAGIRTARLVKYHTRGPGPRSVYGGAESEAETGSAARCTTDISLIRLDGTGWLRPDVSSGAGAYYLWTPVP